MTCGSSRTSPRASRVPGPTSSSSRGATASTTRSTSGSSRPTGSATVCSTASPPRRSSPRSTNGSPAAPVGTSSRSPRPSPLGGVAHHSFHVFAVYPWLGLLRSGTEGPALAVLDRCRIRWGRVVSGGRRHRRRAEPDARVPRRPARARRGADRAGPPRRRRRRASSRDLRAGEVVSLHWDWVCERLSPGRLAALRRANARNLAVVNALPAPGPVVAANSWGG